MRWYIVDVPLKCGRGTQPTPVAANKLAAKLEELGGSCKVYNAEPCGVCGKICKDTIWWICWKKVNGGKCEKHFSPSSPAMGVSDWNGWNGGKYFTK